jgi:hypothetical protein
MIGALRLGLVAVSASRVAAELRVTEETRATSAQMASKSLQMLLAAGLKEIIWTIPLDLLVWHRFRGSWHADLIGRIETACVATWGECTPISDLLKAASGAAVKRNPPTGLALAARLASPSDLKGNPRARFERDLLLISHVAHSLARRILEPLVVAQIVEGWTAVLKDEGFALRAPLEHTPSIEAAIADTKSSGLSGAARLMLAAAPAVKVSLSETWLQYFRLISSGTSTDSPQADVSDS